MMTYQEDIDKATADANELVDKLHAALGGTWTVKIWDSLFNVWASVEGKGGMSLRRIDTGKYYASIKGQCMSRHYDHPQDAWADSMEKLSNKISNLMNTYKEITGYVWPDL